MTLETVVLDADGVLTDGKQYIGPDGEKVFKAFHSRDIRAIRFLVAHGIEVVVISADDWPGLPLWCQRVGARFVYARDKLQAILADGVHLSNAIAVGDDTWDCDLLREAMWSFCPADAHASIKNLDGVIVLDCNGGQGVVAELVDYLVSHGLWEDA